MDTLLKDIALAGIAYVRALKGPRIEEVKKLRELEAAVEKLGVRK